jgi:nitrite reductase/ring-hydroxylating ferredoxin subunit
MAKQTYIVSTRWWTDSESRELEWWPVEQRQMKFAMIDQNLQDILTELQSAADRSWDNTIALPPAAYTSEAFLKLEREKIFRKSWIYVCRIDEIKTPGSYMTAEVDNVPVLVTRQFDGSIKAFANVCTHRSMIVASGSGIAKGFTCPYHGWRFRLD